MVLIIIICPKFRESFLSTHAAIYDPMDGKVGTSVWSEEADMLPEIALEL